MAVPRKKRSKSKKRRQKNIWKSYKKRKIENKLSLVECDNCGSTKLNHRVCPSCGFYKGKQVITVKSPQDNVISA